MVEAFLMVDLYLVYVNRIHSNQGLIALLRLLRAEGVHTSAFFTLFLL